MKNPGPIISLVVLLALAGGWFAGPHIIKAVHPQQPETDGKAPVSHITQADTDTFSITLFQQSLREKERGNVMVAPHIISDTLIALSHIAAGKTLEELQALQLRETNALRGTEPACAILLAHDVNLPGTSTNQQVMPLPFSEDVPMALSIFNGSLAWATGNPDAQVANSTLVTKRTKLISGCTTFMRKDWEIPFHPADTRTSEFDCASGGMPHFQQMRSRGMYRSAKAEDGSWKAVAMPFKKESASGESLVFIAIQSSANARDFASQLTAGQLTDIRLALAAAEAQDTLVELPRMQLRIAPCDMRDTLRRLGLKALFDPASADFSPLTSEKIQLGGFLFSATIALVESATRNPANETLDDAKEYFSFTRPYIWLIADLQTGIPVDFIGLTEEM